MLHWMIYFNKCIVIRSHGDTNSSIQSFTRFNKQASSTRWVIFCVFASAYIDRPRLADYS